jgi:pimeloyl-ACP methyl ester carboxylesterase
VIDHPETTPWREQFVHAADGTRLYLRDRGSTGTTLLLCDGIACDGFIWRYLADDLGGVGPIVHWNYRGHGRSAAPVDERRIGMDALIDDLEVIRDAAVRTPAVLFGHSLGCQVALEGYRRRSAGIAAMVLICGAPGRVTHTFKGSDALARALPGVIERVERHPMLARAVWANLPPTVATRVALATGEVDAGVAPEHLLPYMEHVTNIDLAMFLKMLASVGEVSAEDMLGQIAVPVLVIAGELDTFTPPHLAEKMAAAIPDSELMVVPGATHVVPLERREAVSERILGFLRERVSPHASM